MNGDDDDEAAAAVYRRSYETVMRDDVIHDDSDTINGDNVWASVKSTSKSYTEQMRDVLGSDDEEEIEVIHSPKLYINGHARPEPAPELEEVSADATVDDEVSTAKALFDSSIMTEDVSSISSRSSLRPSRPWQFPAPKRLRMLRVDENGASTSEASMSQFASPSIMSSDEGSASGVQQRHFNLLPYGDPTTGLPQLLAKDEDKDEKSYLTTPSAHSFLRLSRLCILNDKEGRPTVMAVASGVIAVGTKQGKVALFDRSKGWTGALSVEASVSALAISSDKTFIAVATVQGHIYLYDMNKLHVAARHVPPVTTQAVASGRGEGHLSGSRIVHVAFVGSRHTAVVSADEHGLSFYHSLGKILGVSSNDTLRILGRYADVLEAADGMEKRSTILAMSPLPLGPQQHQADAHGFVALLTPSKLVLVGLKPAARTWYRRLSSDRNSIQGTITGSLAWLPCSIALTPSSATLPSGLVLPTLAFSFGAYIYLVRLHAQQGQDVAVREWLSCTLPEPVEAMRWLSHETLVLYSNRTVRLFDVRKQRCTEEQPFLQPLAMRSLPTRIAGRGEMSALLTGSIQSHKGQLFVLAASEIVVGSLITFADRLLAHVSRGDSLGAIRLATAYYGHADEGGSRIGLPELVDEQRPIIAARLLELMRASTAYAFSEERMKDDLAHFPQGVDRTPFFEGLAHVCAEACLALGDLSFLFDELYDAYTDAGIEAVFADQMEDFIVQGRIRSLPIPVVQRLIAFRTRQARFDLAERIIRNVDPACLDLDQAISLCMQQKLYDALIYVYTSALHDYVGPIVELMPLLKIQDGEAYRVFSYLSIALIGRTYPAQERLPDPEASSSRITLYSFLFSGRSVLWPTGPGGRLILTLDADDGDASMQDEPMYPYLRLLLSFDAEALLDALDIAFEDAWLDDEEQDWTRQKIISILHALNGLDDIQRTFLAIFVARNAPKYPQFIRLDVDQVKGLLSTLCVTPDDEVDEDDADGLATKADRQFAVECLLSVYRPERMSSLLPLFERAGFNDILRRLYRLEGSWDKLAAMIVTQPKSDKTFDDLDDVLRHGDQARSTVLQALPALVDADVERSAALVQSRLAGHLNEAIHILDRSPHRQLAFLRIIVESPSADRLGLAIRSQYLDLLCSMQPHAVVRCLDTHQADFFDLDHVAEVARDEDVLDALLWVQDRRGRTEEGLQEMATALTERALVFRSAVESAENDSGEADSSIDNQEQQEAREQIQGVVRMAARICSERGEVEMWLSLLRSLVQLTHDVHGRHSAVTFSRALMQDTLSTFVSSTSAEKVSFSTLFDRLAPQQGGTYEEVRDVVNAMTGAYRVRQDMLGITNRLFDRDVFAEMHTLATKRRRGWRPTVAFARARCSGCGKSCFGAEEEKPREERQPSALSGAPVVPKRKSSVAVDVPTQRTPSFLDASISPRPDKGKGVMRGEGLQNGAEENGVWSADSTMSSLHPDSASEINGGGKFDEDEIGSGGPADYFGMAGQGATLDPLDHFTSLPIANSPHLPQPGSLDRLANGDGLSANDVAAAETEINNEAVVVCFNGTVWHQRCAPAWLTS